MTRRDFATGIAVAAVRAALGPAEAQGRAAVGWLEYGEIGDLNWAAFISALRSLGWREEANLTLKARFSQTASDLAASAHHLLSLGLDVIVTVGVPATRLVQRSDARLPIIFSSVVDAVGNGIVADLNRPERNLTGVVLLDTVPKLMELAKELRPKAKRIAHLFEPVARGPIRRELATQQSEAARRLDLAFREFPIEAIEEMPRLLDVMAGEGFDTLIVDNAGLLQFHRFPIGRQALSRQMAAIGRERLFATAGGLASFGEDGSDLYRRVAAVTNLRAGS